MNRIPLGKQLGAYCITSDDGQRVYDRIYPLLREKQPVVLDFSGVQIVAPPFLNAAIGQLLRDLDSETLNTYLKFENLSGAFKPILHRVIENAKRYYTDPAHRAAVNAVIAWHSENADAE